MIFTDAQIEYIRDSAFRILAETGVCVPDENLRETLARKGFTVSGEWVRIEKNRALEQLLIRPEKSAPDPSRKVSCSISAYAHMVEDTRGVLAPVTMESNIEMAKFAAKAAAQWPFLRPEAPGHPTDVPDFSQFFYQTVHSLLYCPGAQGEWPMDARIAPYCFEAAEIAGKPKTDAHVYVASPLRVAGESLDIVLAMQAKLQTVTVTAMPCLGANTPLNLTAAYAQVLAETLGGAVVVQEVTGLRSYYFAQLFPMDFRAMTMAFGTPEKLLLEWANEEVAARLTGDPFYIRATDIHVMAHRAGEQALLEKGMLAAAGAMRGARHFHTVGSLGMDEVFSPVQMLMDLDMLGCVQKMLDGMPTEDFEQDIVQTVNEGLSGGYTGSDYTLDNMGRYIRYPDFLTRKSLPALLHDNERTMRERAAEKAEELLRGETVWRIEDGKASALEDLVRRVKRLDG